MDGAADERVVAGAGDREVDARALAGREGDAAARAGVAVDGGPHGVVAGQQVGELVARGRGGAARELGAAARADGGEDRRRQVAEHRRVGDRVQVVEARRPGVARAVAAPREHRDDGGGKGRDDRDDRDHPTWPSRPRCRIVPSVL